MAGVFVRRRHRHKAKRSGSRCNADADAVSLQSPCVPGRPANVRRRRLDGDLTARSGTGGGVEVPGSDEQVSEVTGRPLLPRPGRCVGLMSAVPSYLHGPAGYAGEGT